jgi:hypothetical protein
MQIEDLVQIVLDPNLGVAWPKQIDFKLDWYKGRKWRVEYTFASPAVPIAALAVGNEVRGVWRYEVIDLGAQEDGTETVTLRISPERRGFEGYHFIATYRRPSLMLLTAERFEGALKRPFSLRKLPPLEQAIKRSGDGCSFTRTFVSPQPKEVPAAAEEPDDNLEGEEDLFADAELIED